MKVAVKEVKKNFNKNGVINLNKDVLGDDLFNRLAKQILPDDELSSAKYINVFFNYLECGYSVQTSKDEDKKIPEDVTRFMCVVCDRVTSDALDAIIGEFMVDILMDCATITANNFIRNVAIDITNTDPNSLANILRSLHIGFTYF